MSEHPKYPNGSIVEVKPGKGSSYYHDGARGEVVGYDGDDLMVHFTRGEFQPNISGWWFVAPSRVKLVKAAQS